MKKLLLALPAVLLLAAGCNTTPPSTTEQTKPVTQNQQQKQPTRSIPAKPSAQKVKDERANWKTYTSTKIKISFQYPPDWQVSEDSHGIWFKSKKNQNVKVAEDIVADLGIMQYDPAEVKRNAKGSLQSRSALEILIFSYGSQFVDRKETRRKITISGVEATRLTVTSPSIPGWQSDTVLIEYKGKIIEISNGAQPTQFFDPIVATLKLNN